MVASAMDSPSCGMMMGMRGMVKAERWSDACVGGTTLHRSHTPFSSVPLSQEFSRCGCVASVCRTMVRPQIRVIRHAAVFGVAALRRLVEPAEALPAHAGQDLPGDAA